MYFSKHCWFSGPIMGFSFSANISQKAQRGPTFTDLNYFNYLHICSSIHDPWCEFNTLQPQAETPMKHVYTCMFVRSTLIGSHFLLYGSRTVIPSPQPCQMAVIQFEMSRATSDGQYTLTWQPWQRSASYICQVSTYATRTQTLILLKKPELWGDLALKSRSRKKWTHCILCEYDRWKCEQETVFVCVLVVFWLCGHLHEFWLTLLSTATRFG